MKKLLFEQAYVKIFIDESLPALYEQWSESVTEGIEYEDALVRKLDLYREHKDEYRRLHWVNCVDSLNMSDVRAVLWAMRDFHHRMYLAGIRRVAYMVGEDMYYNLDLRDRLPRYDDGNELKTCYFPGLEEAVHWLDGEE